MPTDTPAEDVGDFAPCASYQLQKNTSRKVSCISIARIAKTAQPRVAVLPDVHLQLVAIGEYDLPHFVAGKADWRSVFGGGESDRNLVAGLDGGPGPGIPPQDARTLTLDRPICGGAFIVFHVHKNLAMR